MYEENIVAEEIKDTNPQGSQVVNDKPKKKFNWKKFVGYFVLGLVVLGIAYLGYRFYEFKPYRVIVSNVTSRSATISWVTDSAEPGMVVYKEGNTVLPIWISKYGMGNGYDDRDYSNAELEAANKTRENISESGDITADDIETEVVVTELGRYWSHHVTIRGLNPETEYEFMVGDGLVFEKANTVDTENNIVTTLQEDDEIRTPVPAYGIVRYYDDEDDIYIRSVDAIVYVILKENLSGIEAQTISSSMNMDGGWYVDLSTAVTSSGENFWDVLGDVEVSDVNLELIIENVGFGRWIKTISILQSAPAETIDLSADKAEENDEGLEYQGITFFEIDNNSTSLVQKVFAKPINYDTKDSYASVDNHLIIISNYKTSVTADIVEETAEEEIVSETSAETPLDTSYIQEARGTCGTFDVCEPSTGQTLQCGWFNNSSCNCKCSNGTTGVEWGGTCSCDSSGNPVVTERDSSITTTVDEENWVAKTPENICSNDLTSVSADAKYTCLSSNGCWYSEGYYSRRTYADTGYTCTKTDDGWRWAGEGVTYVDVVDSTISNGVCCINGSSQQWLSGATSCDNAGEGWTKSSSKTSANSCPTIESDGEQISITCYICRTQIEENTRKTSYSQVKPSGCGSLTTELMSPSLCKGSLAEEGTIEDMYKETLALEEAIENVEEGTYCYEESRGLKSIFMSTGEIEVFNSSGSFTCDDDTNSFKKTNQPTPYPGSSCSKTSQTAYLKNSDGEYKQYECKNFTWQESEQTEEDPLGLIVPKYMEIDAGQDPVTCTAVSCKCNYNQTTEIKECPSDSEVDPSTLETICEEEDKITRTVVTPKVSYIEKGGTCEHKTIEALNLDNILTIPALVFAEEDIYTSYILNSQDSIIGRLGVGAYIFKAAGDEYLVVINDEDVAADRDIYLDVNENGEIDDADKNVSEDFETIEVKTITKEFAYTLKEGFNFVSFPFMFYDTNITMASDLLEYLNEEYDDAFYSISKYDSGKWVIVGSNGGTYDQNDFQLIPGQGYVLKAKTDIYITLYGNEVTYDSSTDSAPIGLSEGWNLVGLYGTGVKSYTAESILTDITNYEDINFTAVNVSRWVESRALYEALQRDTDGTVYGLDFPIELKKSYFIKVTEGEGNWEPGIK